MELLNTKLDQFEWSEKVIKMIDANDYLSTLHVAGIGRFTVLDRMTGFGHRDIESGFMDLDGNFFLRQGNFDIRKMDLYPMEAIEEIKKDY